jgi:hypothetical protein
LNVAWATEALFILIQEGVINDWGLKKKGLHTMTLYDLKVRREQKQTRRRNEKNIKRTI